MTDPKKSIRDHVARVAWSEVGDDCFHLGGQLNEVGLELRRVAEIIEDAALGNAPELDELSESGRDIQAACKRGFDALLVALRVAGYHSAIASLDGILTPPPGAPADDEGDEP